MIRDAQQHMRRPEAVYNFRFPVFSGRVGDFVLQKFSKPDALFSTTNTLYPHRSEMEAERINKIEASIEDLTRRLNELRGYL